MSYLTDRLKDLDLAPNTTLALMRAFALNVSGARAEAIAIISDVRKELAASGVKQALEFLKGAFEQTLDREKVAQFTLELKSRMPSSQN
jgi:hypothetical protein